MKRWALLTIGLYVLCLSVVSVPLLVFLNDTNESLLPVFYAWVVPLLVLVQVALLAIPVAIAQDRPIRRRRVIVSAVVGAMPMGALAVGFLGSIILMIWGEEATNWWNWPLLGILAVSWLAWGIVFRRSYSAEHPDGLTSTMTRWLLRGSILEVLVAIPSHIISRQRDDCCAPFMTLFGLATGLSIALLSFGPGIFFIFARRIKDKRRRT
jgi:hypothetical protein